MKSKLIFLIFLLIIHTNPGWSQDNFAPVKKYLVDSLRLQTLAAADYRMLDSCIKAYHTAKHDTARMRAIEYITENLGDDRIWPAYNLWLHHFLQKKLQDGVPPGQLPFYKNLYASTFANMGLAAEIQGDYDNSLQCHQQALKIGIELNDKNGQAESLNKIGLLYHNMGQLDTAIHYYNKSLGIKSVTVKDVVRAESFNNIAGIFEIKGDQVKAMEYYMKSLEIRKKNDDKVGMATTMSNIGALYSFEGNIPLALEYYHASLKIREEINDLNGQAVSLNNIGKIHQDHGEAEESLNYFEKGLKIAEEIGFKQGVGTFMNNIGNLYQNQLGNDKKALEYFTKSKEVFSEMGFRKGVATALNNIGTIYRRMNEIDKSISCYRQALEIENDIGNKRGQGMVYNNIAFALLQKKDYAGALSNASKSLEIAREVGSPANMVNPAKTLSTIYEKQLKGMDALEMFKLHVAMRDCVQSQENQKAAIKSQLRFEYEKKQLAFKAEQDKKDAIASEQLHRKNQQRNAFMAGFVIMVLFAGVFLFQRNSIRKGKKLSDELLLNILPAETAKELKLTGTAEAKSYDEVTVMFTDFKDFTQASENMSAKDLVREINYCYSEFDKIVSGHGIEKIKTIGDSYMCAGGLPVPHKTNASDVVRAAIEIMEFMQKYKSERVRNLLPFFELRIGIHTGPVVAGIVGIKKYAYDIWGDTVNIASRMESGSEAGKINISGFTYELIKNEFTCHARGKIDAKNKGLVEMYFVEGPAGS